jgi:uncharacterized RDD family membrane protein YckC
MRGVNSLVDTRRGIETPEGVRLELRPAGPVSRFAAFAIDFIIRTAVYMILAQVLALAGGMGFGVLLIGVFLLEWFYPVVFELSLAGATPGKRVMGIAVVMDNGLPVNAGASVTRNLLRFVDFLPVAYGFGLLSMLLSADFKRLGDFAAGTQVVYRDKLSASRQLPEASPVAATRPLAADAQLAMIGLAQRSAWLTRERLDELVELAACVDAGHTPSAGAVSVQALRERVFGIAQWLMGRR